HPNKTDKLSPTAERPDWKCPVFNSTDVSTEQVTLHSATSVACPALPEGEFSIVLFWGGREVHNLTSTWNTQTPPEGLQTRRENLTLLMSSGAARYRIGRVSEENAGLYTCVVCKIYPPPYKKEERTTLVLLRVAGKPASCRPFTASRPNDVHLEVGTTSWENRQYTLVTGLCLLIGVSLIFTPLHEVCADLLLNTPLWFLTQCKAKCKDATDNDYVNMKRGNLKRPPGVPHPTTIGHF
uniref:Ig-like domain-containing protein n=1 Tax=Denticeps clupeoides TaxID=299321 RepID=A0AAY4B2S3_9TELE